MSGPLMPREVIVVTGNESIKMPDWYAWGCVCLKGGDADGGDDGYVIIELYDQPVSEQPR